MSASSVGVTDDRLGIVHVTAPAPVGGLERVIQALAIGQHRDGHRVLVIGVVEASDDAHPFFAPLQEAGVAFEAVTLPGRAYLRERREVRALLERHRPDIVHTHGYRSDLLDGPVARSLGVPIVSTVHGSSRMGGLSHLFEWMQRRAWRRFDGVVVVSKSLEADMRSDHASANNLALIANAWPGTEPTWTREQARRHLGVTSEAPVVAFVGRLIPAKGPDLFAQALTQIADLDWQAVIVGDGGERTDVEHFLHAQGLADRVRMVGHQDDATRLFPAFDAFVLSSRTEGTPIVLFEAMAARVPVVVSAVGGVPDVIGAADGWLVAPLQPEATASALRALLANPSEAARRANAARDRLERHFSTRSWLDQHELLYRRIVADTDTPGRQ